MIHNHCAVWADARTTSLLPLSVPPKTHNYRTIKSSPEHVFTLSSVPAHQPLTSLGNTRLC